MDQISLLILLPVLALSSITDRKTGRIPNKAIILSLAASLAINISIYGGQQGMCRTLIPALMTVLIFFPLFLIHKLGAGDVKLLCVIASQAGMELTLKAFCFSIYLAFIPILLHAMSHKGLSNLRIPMAPFISMGVLIGYLSELLQLHR